MARSAIELHGRIVALPGTPVALALGRVRDPGQGQDRLLFAHVVDQTRRHVAIVRKLQVSWIFLGRREFGMMFVVEAGDVDQTRHRRRRAVEMLSDGLVAARAGRVVHPHERCLRTLMVLMA